MSEVCEQGNYRPDKKSKQPEDDSFHDVIIAGGHGYTDVLGITGDKKDSGIELQVSFTKVSSLK